MPEHCAPTNNVIFYKQTFCLPSKPPSDDNVVAKIFGTELYFLLIIFVIRKGHPSCFPFAINNYLVPLTTVVVIICHPICSLHKRCKSESILHRRPNGIICSTRFFFQKVNGGVSHVDHYRTDRAIKFGPRNFKRLNINNKSMAQKFNPLIPFDPKFSSCQSDFNKPLYFFTILLAIDNLHAGKIHKNANGTKYIPFPTNLSYIMRQTRGPCLLHQRSCQSPGAK